MKREGGKTSVIVRRGGRCSSKQFVFSSVRVRDRTKKRERGKTSVVVCRLSSSVVRVLQAHRLLSLFLSHFSLHLSCLFWHNPLPPGTRRSKISNSWYHYCIKWLVLSSAFSVKLQGKKSHFLLLFICFLPPHPPSPFRCDLKFLLRLFFLFVILSLLLFFGF